MSDLIDRISGDAEDAIPPRPKILIFQFVAGYQLYALGFATRLEVADDWDLQGDEIPQATALADAIDAAGSTANKLAYLARIQAISALIEVDFDTLYHLPDGSVDKAKVITDMGF